MAFGTNLQMKASCSLSLDCWRKNRWRPWLSGQSGWEAEKYTLSYIGLHHDNVRKPNEDFFGLPAVGWKGTWNNPPHLYPQTLRISDKLHQVPQQRKHGSSGHFHFAPDGLRQRRVPWQRLSFLREAIHPSQWDESLCQVSALKINLRNFPDRVLQPALSDSEALQISLRVHWFDRPLWRSKKTDRASEPWNPFQDPQLDWKHVQALRLLL